MASVVVVCCWFIGWFVGWFVLFGLAPPALPRPAPPSPVHSRSDSKLGSEHCPRGSRWVRAQAQDGSGWWDWTWGVPDDGATEHEAGTDGGQPSASGDEPEAEAPATPGLSSELGGGLQINANVSIHNNGSAAASARS